MFPIPEKPGDKQCSKCGEIVYPEWHLVLSPFNDTSCYVADSKCPSCGHEMTHVSGSPDFSIPIVRQMEEDGRIS
jgi:Zn finger protein HypA/HybF involved in hydrogenase expression